MEHPFLSSSSLSSKTPEELQNSMSGLLTKLNFASKMGNRALKLQLEMALESYRTAYNKKMDEMLTKKNAKDKINIKEA